MYGVGSFACQLLVSEAFTTDMLHGHLKSVAVTDEVLFRRTVVVAKHLFVNVTEQVKGFCRYTSALESALEQAPEILQTVRVNLPINVPFSVVNRLVHKVSALSFFSSNRCRNPVSALSWYPMPPQVFLTVNC